MDSKDGYRWGQKDGKNDELKQRGRRELSKGRRKENGKMRGRKEERREKKEGKCK